MCVRPFLLLQLTRNVCACAAATSRKRTTQIRAVEDVLTSMGIVAPFWLAEAVGRCLQKQSRASQGSEPSTECSEGLDTSSVRANEFWRETPLAEARGLMGHQDRSTQKPCRFWCFRAKLSSRILEQGRTGGQAGGLCRPNIQCKYQRNIASKRDN